MKADISGIQASQTVSARSFLGFRHLHNDALFQLAPVHCALLTRGTYPAIRTMNALSPLSFRLPYTVHASSAATVLNTIHPSAAIDTEQMVSEPYVFLVPSKSSPACFPKATGSQPNSPVQLCRIRHPIFWSEQQPTRAPWHRSLSSRFP